MRGKSMRHAYLIVAYKNPKQLEVLVRLLDDSRNDIYIMIDKKSEGFPKNLRGTYSKVIYVEPIPIYWGNYTQIEAELKLFKAAVNGNYGYFHILSGMDLPLTNQDIIHEFFDSHPGHEFLTYSSGVSQEQIYMRVYPHHFRNTYRKKTLLAYFWRKYEINHIYSVLKKHPEKKNHIELVFASQFMTIEKQLVEKIIENEKFIYDTFYRGYCVDELFVPTILRKYTKLEEKVYNHRPIHDVPFEMQGNLRYINWWGGRPYTWRAKDFEHLMKARDLGFMFARKFDAQIDDEIITKVANSIRKL